MPQQGPCTGSEDPLQYCSYNLVQPNKYVKKFGYSPIDYFLCKFYTFDFIQLKTGSKKEELIRI